ncbi:MAG: helix-turn-helix transcriptional regulator [Nitrobacter sp.]|jgi:hypothetical protein
MRQKAYQLLIALLERIENKSRVEIPPKRKITMADTLPKNPRPLPYWPRGLSRTLAASYVGVSPGTFDKLVKEGYMPRPKAIYGRRVWDVRAVDVAFDLLDGGYTTKMGEGEVYEFSV